MCGILLIKSNGRSFSKKTVQDLFSMLSARGKDSWGYLIQEDSLSEPKVNKFSVSIDNRFSRLKLLDLVGKLRQSGSLLIHSRLATSGFSGFPRHNHPITFQNIQLVHNGLVTKWPEMIKDVIDVDDTDSQNLAKVINFLDNSRLEEVLNMIEGEITIIWYNKKDNYFNCYTNVGNLYKTITPDFHIYSSEPYSEKYDSKKTATRKIIYNL